MNVSPMTNELDTVIREERMLCMMLAGKELCVIARVIAGFSTNSQAENITLEHIILFIHLWLHCFLMLQSCHSFIGRKSIDNDMRERGREKERGGGAERETYNR